MATEFLVDVERPVITTQTQGEVQRLVRELLHCSMPSGSEVCVLENEDKETVIFDLCVDGARYVLIRSLEDFPPQRVRLSPREHEIARMVAQGYANKTIAAVLDISSWTVGTHLRRIFAKLNVGSRAAMVAQLAENGFFEHHGREPFPNH